MTLLITPAKRISHKRAKIVEDTQGKNPRAGGLKCRPPTLFDSNPLCTQQLHFNTISLSKVCRGVYILHSAPWLCCIPVTAFVLPASFSQKGYNCTVAIPGYLTLCNGVYEDSKQSDKTSISSLKIGACCFFSASISRTTVQTPNCPLCENK